MKLWLQTPVAGIMLAVLFIFSACKKTVTVSKPNASTPLYALVIGDTSLSLFNSALQKAGDSALFHNTDSIVVLAPTNTAFLAQGITSATINAMPAKSLDSIVRYHYIKGPANLPAGLNTLYSSLLGPPLYGYTDSTGNYFFNGFFAGRQTLIGSNAVVYKLNVLLQQPAASVTQVLSADTSLSYFAEALNHAGIVLTASNGWNTVLAPANTAFMAAGYPTTASIDALDTDSLSAILQYHVLPGQYFTNNFTGDSTITTLQGNDITLKFTNAMPQFVGNSDTTAANILQGNRIAGTNVILHKIDRLLRP